jgi:DIS3-like exonuclease 2
MDITTGEIDKSFPPQFARTVMRSCAKWNYQLVQDILDKKITSEHQLEDRYKPKEQQFSDMVDDCFLMHAIAQKRRAKRLQNGSIMLSNREFMFTLDPVSQLPLGFDESKTRMPSKHLVEEYMLMANILVAEHLNKYCHDKTLLRAHPDLDEEKKAALEVFFEKAGFKGEINLSNSKELSLSLEALRAKGDSARFNVALRKFLTCLECAKYMCINESGPGEYQHFGLNFPMYTHFTSPIRRYADLLVHRLMTLAITH